MIRKLHYEEYLESRTWKIKREIFFNKLGRKCFYCHSTENLQVHHKDYRNVGYETVNNVRIVCDKCHREIHGKG